MRIALQPETGPLVWLAGDPEADERTFSSAGDLRLNGDILVQEDALLRAKNRRFRDRGNLSETITFSTVRKFASSAEAQLWAIDYNRTMPRAGTLIIRIDQPGGGIVNRYLSNAVVRPPARTEIGLSILLSYTVQGSAFLTTP